MANQSPVHPRKDSNNSAGHLLPGATVEGPTTVPFPNLGQFFPLTPGQAALGRYAVLLSFFCIHEHGTHTRGMVLSLRRRECELVPALRDLTALAGSAGEGPKEE